MVNGQISETSLHFVERECKSNNQSNVAELHSSDVKNLKWWMRQFSQTGLCTQAESLDETYKIPLQDKH